MVALVVILQVVVLSALEQMVVQKLGVGSTPAPVPDRTATLTWVDYVEV
jgi:hypothetical protein